MQYQTSGKSKAAGITYHLVPEPVWRAQRAAESYLPVAFESDGFIHCTNGLEKLVEVANMFYHGDSRPFRVLALEVARIESKVRYDDPEEVFPHIYGPLNLSAVVGVLIANRTDDGTFLGFHEVEA